MKIFEKFLTPEDPDAFLDFPPVSVKLMEGEKLCPKCKGHGGWNVALNDRPLSGEDDTPENRHRFSHLKALCGYCFGHGAVPESRASYG